jgi:F-type H+-transporting ATPase subunit b
MLKALGIDYAQILTTLIGFVVVVLILRKTAWGPILDFLDARREKIRKDYADADHARGEAEGLKGQFEAKLADIRTLERQQVQEAVKRGEQVAQGVVAEAHAKAEATLAKAQADIGMEAEKAQLALRAQLVDMALLAAEKAINERLDDERHRRLIKEYIDSLGQVGHA